MELDPAISPDGSMVAYVAGPQGQMQLYVRQLGGGRDIPLTEGVSGHHRWPKWSPDGSRIAFQTLGSSGWSINVVPSLGGIPTPLVRPDSAGGQGAHSPAWSPDGSAIAYVVDRSLYTRPLAGGKRRNSSITPPSARIFLEVSIPRAGLRMAPASRTWRMHSAISSLQRYSAISESVRCGSCRSREVSPCA